MGHGEGGAQWTVHPPLDLRQFALALPLYAQDHADRLPPNADDQDNARMPGNRDILWLQQHATWRPGPSGE